MGRPTSRDELLRRIDTDFERLLTQVHRLEPEARLEPGVSEAWSAKDILAHLDAWHEMFLEWVRVGATDGTPELPAGGYTWKETPQLNETIWRRTRHQAWEAVMARLNDSHARVKAVVASYDDEALFEIGRFGWTGSTSLGSYAISATTSHYDWATKLIRRFARARA